MSDCGFVLVDRGLLTHPRFKPKGRYTPLEAMMWLIINAAHTPHEVSVSDGTRRKIVRLERGQIAASYRYLAQAWNMDTKSVQRLIARLVDDQSVTTDTATGQMIITLCNYNKHQRCKNGGATDTATGRATEAPTKSKQLEAIEENQQRARDGEPDGFSEWYAIYPRKVDRKTAARAFAKVIKGGNIDRQTLIERTKAFAAKSAGADQKYIKHPATWLNAGSYDNEPDTKPEPATVSRNLGAVPEAEWNKALKHYSASGGEWSVSRFGPPPGDAGCLVPSHLRANDNVIIEKAAAA